MEKQSREGSRGWPKSKFRLVNLGQELGPKHFWSLQKPAQTAFKQLGKERGVSATDKHLDGKLKDFHRNRYSTWAKGGLGRKRSTAISLVPCPPDVSPDYEIKSFLKFCCCFTTNPQQQCSIHCNHPGTQCCTAAAALFPHNNHVFISTAERNSKRH